MSRRKLPSRLSILALVAALFVSASAPASAQVNPALEMKALVEQGKSADAYQLGKQNPESMGDPDFDYFFGVAANDSGHSSEGVLALERYLLTFPDNHQARLELARGYYLLGEDARAREEFNNVLALKPPPEVIANIERYMDAIRVRESRYQTSSRIYVEAGLGWDSNVNGGVSSSSVNLPVLGTVQIGATGQRQADLGRMFGAGAQVTHPVAPGVAVFGGVDWEKKELRNGGTFETEALTATGGASWLLGGNLVRATGAHQTFWFGHSRFRNLASVAVEWQRQIGELGMLSAGLQHAQIRYAGLNEPRDTDLTGFSLGFRRALAMSWQPVLSFGVTVADDATRRDRPDFGRLIRSTRLGVSASPAAKWGLSMGLSYQESDYRGQDALLLTRREDRYTGVDFGAIYLINRALSLKTDLTVAENTSNIDLYKYRRSAISIKLRYEFK